ncbi:MAG: hypothetical protein JKY34_12545 [Kordiimonadaceae bacterium]|nr:hypothetical protein [Kordiimonadaceae bacterium]PCJ37774.1 MAG: hypothetical protein COA75_03365 [Cellvibrionales bacterium]
MNADELYFGSEFIRWVVVIAFAIYSFNANRQSVKQTVFDEMNRKIITMESQMAHVPTRQQISLLFERLGKMEAEIDGLSKQLKPIDSSLNRINDYLLSHK